VAISLIAMVLDRFTEAGGDRLQPHRSTA